MASCECVTHKSSPAQRSKSSLNRRVFRLIEHRFQWSRPLTGTGASPTEIFIIHRALRKQQQLAIKFHLFSASPFMKHLRRICERKSINLRELFFCCSALEGANFKSSWEGMALALLRFVKVFRRLSFIEGFFLRQKTSTMNMTRGKSGEWRKKRERRPKRVDLIYIQIPWD